jgi:DegV family protein with EDD domain
MVAVVTDSAANLPPDLVARLGIDVVPMYVTVGNQTFRDGVDLPPERLYERLASDGAVATTSTPPAADFLAAFERARPEPVVCVTVASSMSGAHAQAVRAAEAFSGPVEIVDSRSASMAEGFVALEAARAAAAGADAASAAARAREVAAAARLFATVETFDFLRRSGRVTRLQAYAATALDIKPVFAFRDGEPSAVARPRTRRRALERVVSETVAAARGGRLHLAVVHARAAAEAEEVMDAVAAGADVVERYVVEVTPVVGAHVGPGLVGTAFHRDPD